MDCLAFPGLLHNQDWASQELRNSILASHTGGKDQVLGRCPQSARRVPTDGKCKPTGLEPGLRYKMKASEGTLNPLHTTPPPALTCGVIGFGGVLPCVSSCQLTEAVGSEWAIHCRRTGSGHGCLRTAVVSGSWGLVGRMWVCGIPRGPLLWVRPPQLSHTVEWCPGLPPAHPPPPSSELRPPTERGPVWGSCHSTAQAELERQSHFRYLWERHQDLPLYTYRRHPSWVENWWQFSCLVPAKGPGLGRTVRKGGSTPQSMGSVQTSTTPSACRLADCLASTWPPWARTSPCGAMEGGGTAALGLGPSSRSDSSSGHKPATLHAPRTQLPL